MFCFVMALKSKIVSSDWSTVCRLFNASLRSACNQTCPDFKIIVVCHETPDLEQPFDDRVEFIRADFPPPVLDPVLAMRDKWAKLAIGMIRAGQLQPDFVMLMDADDLVSSRIVEFAQAHPGEHGWWLTQGYEWCFGRRWIKCDNQFNCGTNAIVSGRLIHFPRDTAPESIADCIVLRWGHTMIGEKMAEAGTPLKPLPFRGAVYVTGHSDNWSTSFVKRRVSRIEEGLSLIFRHGQWRSLPQLRLCTRSLRREFSMARPVSQTCPSFLSR